MLKNSANYVALYTMFTREMTRVLRIWPQTLLPSIITMTLYYVIFGNLIGQRIGDMQGVTYIEYISPGLVMMAIITNSYANVVSSFFGAKFQRNIEEMLIAPIPNYIIVLGFVSGGVLRGLLVGGLVLLVSLYFVEFNIAQIIATGVVAIFTAVLFSLAGLLNGIFAKSFDDISIVPTFILTPLTYLGGVFYSAKLLPEFWQRITQINPVFYMINGFRYAMLGISEVSFYSVFIVLTVFIIILFLSCLHLLKCGIGVRS